VRPQEAALARNFDLSAQADLVAWHSHRGVIKMKALCAWCCREGKPGYLGEREPLECSLPTHGICRHHQAEVLESLPARSFPNAELLIVVRRDGPALYERLKWSFAPMFRVTVILDRRVSDRRAASQQGSNGRRYLGTRRVREGVTSPLGDFTIFRFTPKVHPARKPSELDHGASALGAFDNTAERIDLKHIALMAETAVMMTRPPTAGWFVRPPSRRTETAR
jgi:hypothetical protein